MTEGVFDDGMLVCEKVFDRLAKSCTSTIGRIDKRKGDFIVNRMTQLVWMTVFFTGCATAGAMNVPGGTSASLALKADILKMINMIERAQAPGCSHRVVDTKVTHLDAAGTVQEEWTVESCGQPVVYPVTLTPDPKGGVYFGVKTPEKETRLK